MTIIKQTTSIAPGETWVAVYMTKNNALDLGPPGSEVPPSIERAITIMARSVIVWGLQQTIGGGQEIVGMVLCGGRVDRFDSYSGFVCYMRPSDPLPIDLKEHEEYNMIAELAGHIREGKEWVVKRGIIAPVGLGDMEKFREE